MTDTFNFRVTTDASGEIEFIGTQVAFGDGYEQDSPLGINPNRERWTITSNGYYAKVKAVRDWLKEHQSQAFFWTPPLGEEGYYKCRRISGISPQGGSYYLITAEFEQVYAP